VRLNKFIAQATGMSRRAADRVIQEGRVKEANQAIYLDGKKLNLPKINTIILNKPVGYVVSRQGQGSETIYDLLPQNYHHLKPVGRLDKDSSGLLVLTNDGELANKLTHPRYQKVKVYEVVLDKKLEDNCLEKLKMGVTLADGVSRFQKVKNLASYKLLVEMSEGRNRQIRRTFESLGYKVVKLHRVKFGNYELKDLAPGEWQKN
jgi:23S rRNA pseudouridine2605 synthase